MRGRFPGGERSIFLRSTISPAVSESATRSIHSGSEGGSASREVPNCGFGLLPIVKTRVAPLATSACENHSFEWGLPLSVIDWMY